MEGFFNFVSLENKTRYSLGKADRLKSRKEIECLFKTGKSFSVFPFRILYLFQEADPKLDHIQDSPSLIPRLQAGFTASSRQFKKAVDRNRIKRLMREAYRLQKNELRLLPELKKSGLTLFFIYVGKELPEYKLVYEKTTVVLNRLIKIASGK